jgi:hypothetical protein
MVSPARIVHWAVTQIPGLASFDCTESAPPRKVFMHHAHCSDQHRKPYVCITMLHIYSRCRDGIGAVIIDRQGNTPRFARKYRTYLYPTTGWLMVCVSFLQPSILSAWPPVCSSQGRHDGERS